MATHVRRQSTVCACPFPTLGCRTIRCVELIAGHYNHAISHLLSMTSGVTVSSIRPVPLQWHRYTCSTKFTYVGYKRRAALAAIVLLLSYGLVRAADAKTLVDMATERFGHKEKDGKLHLSPADEKLFRSAERGEEADYTGNNAALIDPSTASVWPAERQILGDRLVWLCMQRKALRRVTFRGLMIKGARVDGEPHTNAINLSYASIPFPLVLTNCAIIPTLNLEHATVRAIEMVGTHVHGVSADGINVSGNFHFETNCRASRQVRLIDATIGDELTFIGSHVEAGEDEGFVALAMDGVKVRGNLFLSDKFDSKGLVRLPGATIGGDVDCRGSTFASDEGFALRLDRAEINGDVFMNGEFKSRGDVSLTGTTVRGRVDCSGGTFTAHPARKTGPESNSLALNGAEIRGGVTFENTACHGQVDLDETTIGGSLKCIDSQFDHPAKVALSMKNVNVRGDVILGPRCTCNGRVHLADARIRGDVRCDSGSFSNCDDTSLLMDGVDVTGNVSMGKGFQSRGTVRLSEARIGQQLICTEGHFEAPGRQTLLMDGIEVKGLLTLNKCISRGQISLVGATIRGNLDCEGGEFLNNGGAALTADGMKVSGSVSLINARVEGAVQMVAASVDSYFKWERLRSPEKVELDLTSASIGTLVDDETSWPKSGKLHIDGLRYLAISLEPRGEPGRRISWLRRQAELDPSVANVRFPMQPYSQFAQVSRTFGSEETSRTALMQKEWDSAGDMDSFFGLFRFVRNRIYWVTVGYGYDPWRAAYYVIALLVLGTFIFGKAHKNGLIVPAEGDAYDNAAMKELRPNYPPFNSLIYSLETLVPLVKLEQQTYWIPSPATGEPYGWGVFRARSGAWVRRYQWVHMILGWGLATMLIAGMSGLLRTP
jgi:hypothetical protein